MMRIIPRLDIKGPNLVKGIHMEGLRVLGKPEQFARFYYENGADELMYQDAVASLYGRNSLLDIVRKTAQEIFIPLTVGGGLRSIEDIRLVLRAGADKVAINTAAINSPELIRKAANTFGSSTIVVAIEAFKRPDGTYEAYTHYGRERTGRSVTEWALQAAEMGAGELMITSINQEGTGHGFDIDLISKIADSVSIPVIAHGGAGKMDHIREVIVDGKADAVSIASILHYHFIQHYQHQKEAFISEGNIDFLNQSGDYSKVEDTTLNDIKQYLCKHDIECRQLNL